MKSGTISALIVTALIVFGGIAHVISDPSSSPSNDTSTQSDSSSEQTAGTSVPGPDDKDDKLIKADEVAKNNTKDSCWTIINDVVYDVTEYIARHPGGSKILLACGTDGTSLFTQRQDESGEDVGSGTPHSTRASSQLEELRIGTLDTQAE